jgi:hypothetical protein
VTSVVRTGAISLIGVRNTRKPISVGTTARPTSDTVTSKDSCLGGKANDA